MMRYWGYFRSSSSYRLRIALNLKSIECEFVPVHLTRDGGEQKKDGYRGTNPQMLVPAIEHEGEIFTQSLSIIEWLDEKWPAPPLLPDDADLRARVRAFSQMIACEIQPLQNLRVLQYLRNEYGQDEQGVERWCQRWIGDGLTACEEMLSRAPRRGAFCFGKMPGPADICLVPQVFSARRFGIELANLPCICEIADSCDRLPAFAEAHPSRQPDFE